MRFRDSGIDWVVIGETPSHYKVRHPEDHNWWGYMPRKWAIDAKARITDPVTSHMAAKRANGKAAADAEAVLQAHAEAGERGLTGEELELAMRRPYQSVGPRRPGLERQGLLIKAGTRTNSRGNTETVYRITRAGLQAAQQLRSAS